MCVTKYQQTQEINKLTFYCVLGLEVNDSAQVIPLHSLHHFQPPHYSLAPCLRHHTKSVHQRA